MNPVIHLEAGYLPLYALFSLMRGVAAYGLSFLFTMVYGYAMARVPRADRFLGPLLDVLQSIPVLGFMPGFVIGLSRLFPTAEVGLEMASVLMIFTGQVWNMTFSFQASLKSVPRDLVAVARLSGMSWWTRFVRLDLAYSATGLIWNSMMSMAGGWFFLMVSEAFVLGERDFRLPGLGSYMSLAVERGDRTAQVLGVVTMLLMIVVMDQVVWRPLVAWSKKFTDEDTGGGSGSWVLDLIRRSRLRNAWMRWRTVVRRMRELERMGTGLKRVTTGVTAGSAWNRLGVWTWRGLGGVLRGAMLFLGLKYLVLLHQVTWVQWCALTGSLLVTFGRVMTAVVLASAWTIPAGVWIGRNPGLSRLFQPLIQMAASFPAPMVFPLVVGGLLGLGVGLGWGSIVLLLMGTQWYVLVNVIAATTAIPRELWELSRISGFTRGQRWRRLLLPGIFPGLLTGWITATGGAWNASIVAEYLRYDGRILDTVGLGAAISRATEHGDFPQTAAAVGLMAVAVVGFNRWVWHPLGRLAQTRYSLEN